MDVRAAITNFISHAGRQRFRDEELQQDANEAAHNDIAVQHAIDGIEDLARDGGVEDGELQRFVRENFATGSGNENGDEDALIADLRRALDVRPEPPDQGGNFHPGIRIDTSTTTAAPGFHTDDPVEVALVKFAMRESGDQRFGTTSLETGGTVRERGVREFAGLLRGLLDGASANMEMSIDLSSTTRDELRAHLERKLGAAFVGADIGQLSSDLTDALWPDIQRRLIVDGSSSGATT